jgi:hypothetical protein
MQRIIEPRRDLQVDPDALAAPLLMLMHADAGLQHKIADKYPPRRVYPALTQALHIQFMIRRHQGASRKAGHGQGLTLARQMADIIKMEQSFPSKTISRSICSFQEFFLPRY